MTRTLPSPTSFLDQLFASLESSPGDLGHLYLDHLCYRVDRVEHYEILRDLLLTDNELLVESPINGRRIATFRLRQPIRYKERAIYLLELPEPKVGSPYPEGYEHVEFVSDRPLEAFAGWLIETLGISSDQIDYSGMEKQHNADLRIKLPGGISVKFHEQPLDKVIEEELRAGAGK